MIFSLPKLDVRIETFLENVSYVKKAMLLNLIFFSAVFYKLVRLSNQHVGNSKSLVCLAEELIVKNVSSEAKTR